VRLGQWIGLLALVISLYILWQIVLLVFAAAVLSTILNRVVQTLQRYRIKRSIAITVVVLLALIIGFFAVIVPRIVEQLQQLFNILPQVSTRLRAWFGLQSVIPGQC